MAAYCYEQIEEFKPAWNCGQKALDVGELMEPDKRETTTLPYAGQGLLRVAKAGSSSQLASKVNQQMIVLIGPDWEQLLEEGAAKS